MMILSSAALPTPAPKGIQLHSLTIARGIAAWLVLFYHVRSGMDWLPAGVLSLLSHGYLAVDFFFLLSGFVIWMTAHQQLLDQRSAAIWPFLRRRFARIYPLYIVMLGLTVLFAAMLIIGGRDASNYPWHELPLHISMTQNWGFTDGLKWNHPAWSISTEMAAYLVFPILVLCTPIARASHWTLLIACTVFIALLALCFYASGLKSLGDDVTHYGLIRCLMEFTIGAMVCAIWLKQQRPSGMTAIILPAIIAVTALTAWTISPPQQLWAFPTFAAASIYILAELSRRSSPGQRPTMLKQLFIYMGEISYATYLSHFMLFIWFKIALVEDPLSIPPHLIMGYIILAFAFSGLLHHFVELPGRRYLSPTSPQKSAR